MQSYTNNNWIFFWDKINKIFKQQLFFIKEVKDKIKEYNNIPNNNFTLKNINFT